MTQLYQFLIGPGLTISIAVFVLGLTARLVLYFMGLDWKLDRVAYKVHFGQGMVGGLHSAFKWLIPFATVSWRAKPLFTVFFFLLHIGAVLIPLFLLGHAEVLLMRYGIHMPALGQNVADALTIAALVGLACITIRRVALPEVRILTTAYDYFILALVAVPFASGFIARMSATGSDEWMLVHLISGELMLILAPFTKLSHIALYFASRWQLGADFSIKRGGHSRGPCFPW